jgi:sugar O-acyltransferase (sialic acid O-acetyltransferase NeuD family)
MNDLAIYGAGGFGREITCIINAINQVEPTWNFIGYFDDGCPPENCYGNVIGNLETLNNYPKKLAIVMAIASPRTLENLTQKISNPKIYFPNIIAPNVLFFNEKSIECGHGNVLGYGVRISCEVKLGDFNLLNGCVSLGHDVIIGNYNVMQPETRISGETTIGNSNFFGVRSLVLQGLTIGNHTRVGAGSVIMRKTKDGMLYFGNPAKKVEEE